MPVSGEQGNDFITKERKTMKNRKLWCALMALCLCAVMMLSGCADESKIVRVYNWGDYIDPDVTEMFEEETGYTVRYEMYETNEDLYTKMANSNVSYDVIIPSDYMIERMISEDMLAKINMDNIPNLANIDPEFFSLSYDPNDEYSVPYMWGTLGILYNTTMVDEEIDSFASLWDEKYEGNIIMMNSQRDALGAALKYLGYSLNSTDEAQLAEAQQLLIDQSPLVLGYFMDETKDKMIAGEAALALVYAGDAVYCIDYNEDLKYVIPKEGSNIFYDAMCIPANCTNQEGAEAFINFMCRPDIAARNADYIGYSSPSSIAREQMEDGQNPTAYPDLSQHNNLEAFSTMGDQNKLYDKVWTEVLAKIGA